MTKPLTKAQLKTLLTLDEHGELPEKRVLRLAELGGPQGTQAVLRSLVSRGLVDRTRAVQHTDLDSYYSYRITDAGRKEVAAS